MNFLRALFWIVLTIVLVVFSMRNWTVVTVVLSGGFRLDAKLPVLLLIAFLAGLLPALAILQTSRWRLRRRLDAAERALADLRTLPSAPAPELPPAPLP